MSPETVRFHGGERITSERIHVSGDSIITADTININNTDEDLSYLIGW